MSLKVNKSQNLARKNRP